MKIVYLLGKSASGKDTLYTRLREETSLDLKTVILYTTRPMRDGERQGEQYHFISEAEAEALETAGKVIEERVYQTVYGPWKYLTADDGQFQKDGRYLMIGTLESYRRIRDYFGEDRMLPIYLEVEDGLRLERAMARERTQKTPKYAEMCRRFLADEEDFSEEKIAEAGIGERFDNTDLELCVRKVAERIRRSDFADENGRGQVCQPRAAERLF